MVTSGKASRTTLSPPKTSGRASVLTRPLVLYYHGFGTRSAHEDPHNLFVEPASFEHQLDTLSRAGWTPLTLTQYIDGWSAGAWPRRSFLLTIDDGYVSTLDIAAPRLAARGIPAVLYVPAACLGGVSGWMPSMPNEELIDAVGVQELSDFGVDVEVHGLDHRDMVGLDREELRRQTQCAKSVLADVTGRTPRSFAYPSGRFDAAAVAAVREAGYDLAFSVDVDRGRFGIPRVGIDATDTPRTFQLKLSRYWPAIRRTAGQVPRMRAAAHRLIGSARPT